MLIHSLEVKLGAKIEILGDDEECLSQMLH